MGMVDILKLNAEIDEMIARQNTEIKVMKEKTYESKREKYEYFMNNMHEYYNLAAQVADSIDVFVGCYDDGYGNRRAYSVIFDKRQMLLLAHDTTIGDSSMDFGIRFNKPYKTICDYGFDKKLDKIAEWFMQNEDLFKQRFEDACVKAIKRKAEKANSAYVNAERKYREVCGDC